MKKIYTAILIAIFVLTSTWMKAQEVIDTLFYEAFNSSVMPTNWTQERLVFQGSDLRWEVTQGVGVSGGIPSAAKVGSHNLSFQKQGNFSYVTRMITPPIVIEAGNTFRPELRFWHAQRTLVTTHDNLKILYREGKHGTWTELMHYESPSSNWEARSLLLPQGVDTTYIAFEGKTNWGGGVLVDEVQVVETQEREMFLAEVSTGQASVARIASGTNNNPIIHTRFLVLGNSGEYTLNSFTVHSANTSDTDIKPQGVKLYLTRDINFNMNNPVGNALDFENGVAVFDNLDLTIDRGYSYLWVTYDIKEDAGNLHIANAYVPQNAVQGSSEGLFPEEDQNPMGHRVIYHSIFYDDFDTDKGWILSGEFERALPQGRGGASEPGGLGNPGPGSAHTGSYVLGTDITGLGDYPGNYEPNLEEREWQAISPAFDCTYFKDVNLSFQRWLNIFFSGHEDMATIDVSTDDGATWTQIWRNDVVTGSAITWTEQNIEIPMADRQPNVRFRFTLGPTSGSNNYSGWHIDNLMITGDHITLDTGVTGWLYPDNGCGLTDSEHISVTVKNFAAVATPVNLPIGFSIDGGNTWHMEAVSQSIAPSGSVTYQFSQTADFSQPGEHEIWVRTFLEGDQHPANDQLLTTVYSVPTYSRPYSTDFSTNNGFWRAAGPVSSWQWETPSGTHLNSAQSGTKAWATQPHGAFTPGETSWIESPCFNLLDNDYTVIEFMMQTHTPSVSGVTLQYSLNEGTSWHVLNSFEDTLTWGWHNAEQIENLAATFGTPNGWAGAMDDFEMTRMVLPPLLTSYEKVMFRLVFAGDMNEENYEGVVFDSFRIYQAPHDVGVTQLTDPQNDCILSDEQTFTVTIHNLGINNLPAGSSIPVSLQVNEGVTAQETAVLDGPLLAGHAISYTFEATHNLTAPGLYEILASTHLPDDNDFYHPGTHNDTLEAVVEIFGFPEPFIGEDIYTLMADTLVIDAGEGYISYLWQDGSTQQTFTPAGNETAMYHVVVTDENGCPGKDSLHIFAHDVAVWNFETPVDTCFFEENQPIEVVIKNTGPGLLKGPFSLTLTLAENGVSLVSDAIERQEDLEAGESFTHLFSAMPDMSPMGVYWLSAFHDIPDANPENDALSYSVESFGYPQVSMPEQIITRQPDTIVLNAGEGFHSYLWCNSSEDQFFHAEDFGTYTVAVGNHLGCLTWAETAIIPEVIDLTPEALPSPGVLCAHTPEAQVQTLIRSQSNIPLPAGTEITMGFQFNEGEIIIEELVLNEDLPIDGTFLFTFENTLADIGDTSWELIVWAKHFPDDEESNDTLFITKQIHPLPVPFVSADVFTLQADTLIFDAGPGYTEYLWDDGHTESTYEVTMLHTHEYTLTVTDENQCQGSTSIWVYAHDIGITELISPASNCELSDEEEVAIKVVNTGHDIFPEGFEVSFSLIYHETEIITETLTLDSPWLPAQELLHQWSTPVNLSAVGQHPITVLHDHDGANPSNNSLHAVIEVFGYPTIDLAADIYTTMADTLVLNAGEGFSAYQWNDGTNTFNEQFYTPSILPSHTYQVAVTDSNNCSASHEFHVHAYDIALTQLVSPYNLCDLPEAPHAITIRLTNTGHDILESGTTIPLTMLLNDQTWEETFVSDDEWHPGEHFHHTFTTEFYTEVYGSFPFEFYHGYPDAKSANDTLRKTIHVTEELYLYLGDDIYTTQPDTLAIDAGEGFVTYLWQDGTTDRFFTPTQQHSGLFTVTVTDPYGCEGTASVQVNTFDFRPLQVITPLSNCTLSTEEQVSFLFHNNGHDTIAAGSTFPFTLETFEGETTEETISLEADFLPGDSLVFSFTMPLDLSENGDYSFTITYDGTDANAGNNTLLHWLQVAGLPEVSLGYNLQTLQADTLVIDAGEGFTSYVWSDGQEGQFFTPTALHSETYSVIVTDIYNCLATDTIHIIAHDLAIGSFNIPSSHCGIPIEPQAIGIDIINTGHDLFAQGAEITLTMITDEDTLEEIHTLAADLAPGDTVQHVFAPAFLPVATGNYAFTFSHGINDVEPSNNTFHTLVAVFEEVSIQLGEDIWTTQPDTLLLDAGEGFAQYLWQDGHTEQIYQPPHLHSATYTVWATADTGCTGTDSIRINTFDYAPWQVIAPTSNCTLPETGSITFSLLNNGHDTIAEGETLPFGFSINSSQETEEVFITQNAILPGETAIFTTQTAFTFPDAGQFPISVTFSGQDAHEENNFLESEIHITGMPTVNLGENIVTARPDTIILDAGPGYHAYSWHDGQDSQFYQVNSYGLYWVTVSDSWGCQASDTIKIEVNTIVEDLSKAMRLEVYPVPARDHIYISCDFAPAAKPLTINIIDMAGKSLYVSKHEFFTGSTLQIPISHVKPGVYFIRLEGEGFAETIRFIKQ